MKHKKVDNLEHFQKIVKNAKKKYGNLSTTNLLLLGKALEGFIEKGITYEEIEGGVCFFEPQSTEEKIYFMLEKEGQLVIEEKNLVTEFMERNLKKVEQYDAMLKKAGFKEVATYVEMICKKEEHKEICRKENDGKERQEHIEISFAKSKNVKEVLALWEKSLDIKAHPLPTAHECRKMIQEDEIVVLYNENREIIGATRIRGEHNNGYLEYLAIHPKYRKNNYGKAILDWSIQEKSWKSIRIFVNKKQEKLIAFYERNRYNKTGKELYQYRK